MLDQVGDQMPPDDMNWVFRVCWWWVSDIVMIWAEEEIGGSRRWGSFMNK